MLKDLNTVEEIKEYFKEIEEKPMADMNKARIYGMAKAYQDICKKEKPVKDYYEIHKSRYTNLLDVIIISEDILIAKERHMVEKEEKIWFVPFVNGKKIMGVSEDFDYALLLAISEKYDNCGAAQYIVKMLEMDHKINV